jgi:hypothetical protein
MRSIAHMDLLLDLDHLSPIERLDALVDARAADMDLAVLVLLALEAIDVTIGSLDDSRNFYIFQDDSVRALLAQAMVAPSKERALTATLIVLNEVDLIFRFTTALKFGVSDASLKQLRINSWGKAYIRQKRCIQKHSEVYDKLKQLAGTYVAENEGTYVKLLQLLGQKITPAKADKVARLNAKLTLKLVS